MTHASSSRFLAAITASDTAMPRGHWMLRNETRAVPGKSSSGCCDSERRDVRYIAFLMGRRGTFAEAICLMSLVRPRVGALIKTALAQGAVTLLVAPPGF